MLQPLYRQPTYSTHRIGVLFVFFILLSQAFEQKVNRHFVHAQRKKEKFVKESKNREENSKSSCSGSGGEEKKYLLSRHPRDLQEQWGERRSKFGNAVYFSGRQVLKLTPSKHMTFSSQIPMGQFTAEIWVRPEGGQADPVPFLVLHDTCDGDMAAGQWSVGFQTHQSDGESDARIYFSLKAHRSLKHTVLMAHEQYTNNKWVHVAVTYDGTSMVLYINNARVTVSTDQQGHIFNLPSSVCKEVHIGGDIVSGHGFRGTLDVLRLWNIPLSHFNISKYIFHSTLGLTKAEGLTFQDDFNDVRKWTLVTGRSVGLVNSDIPYQQHDVSISAPPCGKTVCDDPDVVLSYTNNWQLRHEKVIRYRIINLMEDDGLNPHVTSEQIFIQHEALNTAFEPYNITFDLYVENIKNTSLRKRLIMIGCDPANVGDGVCQVQCQHMRTGNDGGDCDPVKVYCDPQRKGNGKCDFGCNRAQHEWDLGDCCLYGPDTHYTCYDHSSPWRGYMGIEEYREALQISASSHLNVFFASTSTDQLIGLATFPWENHVYSLQGGTVVQPETFGRPGQTDSLVHEIGHNLGLWHVHHGVSELDCNDPCVETYASMEHGDMCADTAPTPQNLHCHDPDPSEDKCGLLTSYTSTPYQNYMSYADDNCTNHFSPNQVARMHCYLDLVYKPWTTSTAPSPVPLPPRVLSSDMTSATIAWIPPFTMGAGNMNGTCALCTMSGALFQFADSASSPAPQDISGEWGPMQATGPPDADTCDVSTRVWMPKVNTCTDQVCYIDLTLRWPVKPARLSVWVTWHARKGVRKIRLYYEDGTLSTLTEVDAYCDIPFTIRLDGDRKLMKIRIYTRSPYVAIDALEVLSQPINEHCLLCPPIKYKVSRSPPFADDDNSYTNELRFSDLDLVRDRQYTYWVSVLAGSTMSALSPPLVYTHGQHYCGDGHVHSQGLEECDDNNAVDGDGCNIECKIEDFFHCKGSPSLCYRHDGDGVCEDFEVRSSVADCGYYTPQGFTDQWAHAAVANPVFQLPKCPESVIAGPPQSNSACGKFVDTSSVWFPCGSDFLDGNFWVEVYFPEPAVATEVLVYIGSDGRSDHDPVPKNISVDLIKTNNHTVGISSRATTLNCADSVTSISVSHDLSQPFFHTKGVRISFHSYNISIQAVKLRSTNLLDPVKLASCGPQEVYNPRSGHCVVHNCSTRCNYFSLPHSKPQCTGNGEGHTCTIQCQEGYRLEGETSLAVCASGVWLTSSPVACVPVDCFKPMVPFASSSCPYGTTFNTTCTFKCNPPARQQGFGTVIRCESDGLWSIPTASCHVRCEPPLQIPHAKLITRQCKRGRKSIFTTCKFRCKKGFHVEKQKNKRRVFQLTCGLDGAWGGGRCVRVQCPPLPLAYAGLYRCTNNVNTFTRCVLKCKDNSQARQKIICKSNGVWSGAFKPCLSFETTQCKLPSRSKDIILDSRENLSSFGSTVKVGCRLPLQELVYTHGRSRDRHITTHPLTPGHVITNITCTGSTHWFPNPSRLACVEKCSVKSMSDGWCDGHNNRQHCDWDGGDCCPSTSGGKVFPFPETCTHQCTCKDPRAKENVTKKKKGRKKKKGN